jgi:hypothetical protein
MTEVIQIDGKDNSGRQRQEFADKIAALDDKAFFDLTEKKIWLSAYASNNPRSDFHWQADACYSEANRRGNPEIYKQAWEKAARVA